MRNPLAPSTQWKERIAEGEAERHARHAEVFAEIQARKAARWGTGRALHRKQVLAAVGSLEVLDGLPGFARQGLFEIPRDYEVWVRLSNGGMDRAPDRTPDVRGFAMRVFGVHGAAALGGAATHQDFTLINHESFSFPGSDEFVDFAEAASQGHASLLRYMVRRYGALRGPARLLRMAGRFGQPFSGFATEEFHSAVPMANGPYAVRVRLLPDRSNGSGAPGAREDWAADFGSRLRDRPLHWELQLQFYAGEAATPIEDASVSWATPYSTVARLMLPRQELDSAEGREMAARAEASVFDPWQGLAAHRPLGEVQRARKVVYLRSQQGRAAAG